MYEKSQNLIPLRWREPFLLSKSRLGSDIDPMARLRTIYLFFNDFYFIILWSGSAESDYVVGCVMPVTETSWLSRLTWRNWSNNLH